VEYLEVTAPVLCLMANVIVQVLGFRFVSSLGMLKSVFLGFGAGLLCLLLIESSVFAGTQKAAGDFAAAAAANLIIYSALGYCYFHFINLGETARRIRILRELYEAGSGLTLGDIIERYSARDIVRARLQRLLSNGQVVYNNGRYYYGKPAVLMIARSMVMLKRFILGKRSEFD
jgi:hypothetical protein